MLWAGLVLLIVGRPRAAGVMGAVAVGLGLSYLYLLLDRSMVWQRRFLVGYFAWLASMAVLSAAGFGLRSVGSARRGGGAGADATGNAGR